MREILFRGKRVDNGKWVEGELLHDMKGRPWIYWTTPKELPIFFLRSAIVKSETVGEYTGLTDKNGKKIFEGDIVKTWRSNIGKIEFGQYWDEETETDFYGYAWIGKDEYGESITLSLDKRWGGHEVIGTIYDNPELLAESDKRE